MLVMGELDSARAKLDRARRHINELGGVIAAWRLSRPYSFAPHIDGETDEQHWTIVGDPTPPPVTLAMGDALYNLRSALDHAAWQLVLKAGSTPSRKTEFPIFDDPDRYDKESVGKLKGMNPEMKDFIRDLQPFRTAGSNPNHRAKLLALQHYGNIDKHRQMVVTNAGSAGMFWDPSGEPDFVHTGPVTAGLVIARCKAGQYKNALSSMPGVCFGDGPAAGKDVQVELGGIELRVTRVLDAIDAKFFT